MKGVILAALKFVPHKNPCTSSAPRDDAPRDFYPASAKRRGEEGTVVLRTRINADSCGLASAIVVSTGSPALDEAGLLTAEYTRFKPATENGAPINSEVTFAVKFVVED
jgi:periplasmic protein TonB